MILWNYFIKLIPIKAIVKSWGGWGEETTKEREKRETILQILVCKNLGVD